MANDLWRTPPEVFNTLNEQFNFIADMACSEENKLCFYGFTEQDNSLSAPWLDLLLSLPQAMPKFGDYVWCNPPYSNPMPWVKQAISAKRDGIGTVMLLNSDCSVGWFAEALTSVSEIMFVVSDKDNTESKNEYTSGRIGFVDGDGNAQKGNNKPQFILMFDPKRKSGDITTKYITKKQLYGEK